MGFHQRKRWVSRNIATDTFAVRKAEQKDSLSLATGLWLEKWLVQADSV